MYKINCEKKRKRVKSHVPSHERCLALRSCSDQCSRRRSVSSYYCGTHKKGIPHGSLSCSDSEVSLTEAVASSSAAVTSSSSSLECGKKVEVCAHEIDGIKMYIVQKIYTRKNTIPKNRHL
jgi:hypothetical protein